MKYNRLKSIGLCVLVLCCVLLTTAHAQEAGSSPPDQSTAAPAVSSSDTSAEKDEGPSADDDESGETESRPKHHHHHGPGWGGDNDVVSVGGKADLASGQHAGSVVAVFGSATSAGEVSDAVVSVMGNTRVTGGNVGDSAVAVMGSVYINGFVAGDVVAVFGNVELGPEARVRGDVVVIGGQLRKDPAASLEGRVQQVFDVNWSNFEWLRPWIDRCLLYGRPLAFTDGIGWAWGIALGLLALYVFIAFAFRGAVERCVHTFETEPGHSVVAALLTMLLAPVLVVLLLITVLGAIAVPFLVGALFLATVFGKIVMLAFIGRRCTPMLANDPVAHTVVGVLVGGVIVLVLYTIPVVGFVVYKALDILGLGVVVATLLATLRATRQGRAGPSGGARSTAEPLGESSMYAGPAMGAQGATASGSSDQMSSQAGGQTMGMGGSAAMGSGFGGAEASASGAQASGFAGGEASGLGAQTSGSGAQATGGGGQGSGSGGNTSGSAGSDASAASLPRAGFMIRMGALLLDILLVGIVLQGIHEGSRLHLVILAVYGAVMWKLKAATIGGIICGLRVVRIDGRPIDWPTAIARALGCFLSIAAVGLGFFWIAIDSDRQAWHDKIAGTLVVRAPKGASLL